MLTIASTLSAHSIAAENLDMFMLAMVKMACSSKADKIHFEMENRVEGLCFHPTFHRVAFTLHTKAA